QQWFHMNTRVMLHDVQFEADGDLELTLALAPAAGAQLARQGADVEAVLRALVDAEDAPADLAAGELWFLVEATQSVTLPEQLKQQGGLKVGFQTKWREDILHLLARNKRGGEQAGEQLQASMHNNEQRSMKQDEQE